MEIVTRKPIIREYLDRCLKIYHTRGVAICVQEVQNQILNKKVKFPLLEYCGRTFYEEIAENEHLTFCDHIEALKTEGGNVLLGIMLQERLKNHFDQSLQKATEYTAKAHIWYVCDIIGERVFGYGLLHYTSKAIPEIQKLFMHPTNWVVRSLGAGVHYAIKKGLEKEDVKTVFKLLLSKANSKDKEICQGVGWAAKTTAKFHPEIIDFFEKEIGNNDRVAHWFRAKIKIGLNRNAYAKRN